MMSKIRYYGGANKIRQFEEKWKDDHQSLALLLKETEESIKYTRSMLIQNGLHLNIEFIEGSVDNIENKIMPWISVHNTSGQVLYTFVWDCQTPFFSTDVDRLSSKFDSMKKMLTIANSESQRCENNRSSKAYSPNKSKQLSYCNNEADLFEPGQYCHMVNRAKAPLAHLGLLVTKPHHEKPIDSNPLAQWCVENYLDEQTRDKVRKPEKMITLLSNDTIYQRLKAFQLAFTDMIYKTVSYSVERPQSDYSEIFIFLNPIISADDHYIQALKELAIERCQFMLSKNVFFEAGLKTPKFTIILLNSTDGFTCSEYFSPRKTTSTNTKDLVI